MNVLDGEFQDGSLRIGNSTLQTRTVASGKVNVGIRPEHVTTDPEGPLYIVQMGEPLGPNTLLHGRSSESSEAFTISLPGVQHAKPGEVIAFRVDPKKLLLFDPNTGARIG